MAMDWVLTARRILHGEHDTFLAGKLGEVFRQERRDLGLLGIQREGHKTYEDQNQFCNRHDQTFRVNETIKIPLWNVFVFQLRVAAQPVSVYNSTSSERLPPFSLRA